jgi:hypoxanthine phosphoribosyltransferase
MQDLAFSQITDRLKSFNLPHFDLVIGIAEGGLVPAGLVAFKLGSELGTIKINFRDEKNNPIHEQPLIFGDIKEIRNKKILIVDDVSVTGKTLEIAKKSFAGNDIQTFTLKGKADYVLFPEISECVNWPWKLISGLTN